jgi:hypothetical protein
LIASLSLIGVLLSASCDSESGNPARNTDTGPSDPSGDTSTDQPADTPDNLPNLSTDPSEPSAETPTPEPVDCEVLTLTSCVTEALDELSNCLAAGHGGTFTEDHSRCDLPEADAVVTFSQAVPRFNSAFALSFTLEVAGENCARYAERGNGQGIPDAIELSTAQHIVSLEMAPDLQRTLTCNGTSVSFRQSKLSECHDSKAMPTPELIDQTLDGLYQVSPMQQSNRRIFNCRFMANGP